MVQHSLQDSEGGQQWFHLIAYPPSPHTAMQLAFGACLGSREYTGFFDKDIGFLRAGNVFETLVKIAYNQSLATSFTGSFQGMLQRWGLMCTL